MIIPPDATEDQLREMPVTLELPIDMRDEIKRIAQLENVSEEIVLTRSWLSFLRDRQPELEAQRRRLQEMDDEAYLTATQPDLDESPERLKLLSRRGRP